MDELNAAFSKLKAACFEIEERLESNPGLGPDNDSMAIRRELYTVRCAIGAAQNRANIWGVKLKESKR